MVKRVDAQEFQQVYETYKEVVLKSALYYTEDASAAESVMQQVFFKLYKHMRDMNLEFLEAWLLITTKNIVDAERRKEVKEGNVREFSEFERKDKMFEALYQKNRVWYHAVTLVYCMDKTYEQAAQELEIGTSVIQDILYRAKKWMKEFDASRSGRRGLKGSNEKIRCIKNT